MDGTLRDYEREETLPAGERFQLAIPWLCELEEESEFHLQLSCTASQKGRILV